MKKGVSGSDFANRDFTDYLLSFIVRIIHTYHLLTVSKEFRLLIALITNVLYVALTLSHKGKAFSLDHQSIL